MKNYDKLKLSLRYWLLGRDYHSAVEALEFAAEYHTGVRKDGLTPEFEHQIRIAHFIRTLEPSLLNPEDTIASALLHDVVEDHPVPLDAIYRKFGKVVGTAVDMLTKNKGKDDIEYYKQMETNAIASIVKGADRMHNVQSMQGVFTSDKQLNYVAEVNHFILPMLRNARRNFPTQEAAYENIKHVLRSQVEFVVALNTQREV